MRESLFRGKDRTGILNKDWLFGCLDNLDEDYPRIIYKDRWGNRIIADVDKNTVGQFTGLTDKHGNKIFEGDILQEYNGDDIGYMRYDDEDGMYYLVVDNVLYDFSTCSSKWYEVIGNIHDNPELLE